MLDETMFRGNRSMIGVLGFSLWVYYIPTLKILYINIWYERKNLSGKYLKRLRSCGTMCDVRVYDFLCVILAKNQLETLGLVWLVLATESKFIIGNFKKKIPKSGSWTEYKIFNPWVTRRRHAGFRQRVTVTQNILLVT